MSSLPVKPGPRHSVSDWSSNNHQLCAAAGHERHVSTAIRQEGRELRSHAHSQTIWDEGDSSRRLADRLQDVTHWKQQLELCAQRVDQEMEALTLCKQRSEEALAATAVPLEVSGECLALREGRRGAERVLDPVDQQLQAELDLIGRVRRALQQHADQAFEQLCVLQEVRHQLTADLQNKMEALDVDMSCLSLTAESPGISLKTDPTRIPPGSSSPQEWRRFSEDNLRRARDAVETSQLLREDTCLRRAQLQNDLDAQRRAMEFQLRRRSHEEERQRARLQWSVQTAEDEILEAEQDVQGLEAELRAKTGYLKLAHTRLETRTSRPGPDLCRDQVQLGLVAEVQQLEANMAALQQQLCRAQRSLQDLRLLRSQLLQDLGRKQEALSLERRSINTRLRLAPGDRPAPGPAPGPVSGSALGPGPGSALVPLANSSGRSHLQMLAQ